MQEQRTWFSSSAKALGLALLLYAGFSAGAHAAEIPGELQDVGFDEKLGGSVTLSELTFKNEAGQSVQLSDYFKSGKPVLLNLLYFECPNLCNFLLNGMVDTLKTMDWTPGRQFEIVSVSVDPREGPELAAKKKASYLKSYSRPEAAEGWHFLTSPDESQVKRLADQVGFKYKWDEKEKQYAHGAALFILTPQGKISRYLYGVQFKEKDLRLALVEASDGKIGTIVDRILLFCYRYNPVTRTYSIVATRLMQAGGAVTVLVLGLWMLFFWRSQKSQWKGESIS
jgi:protein SCO1/2